MKRLRSFPAFTTLYDTIRLMGNLPARVARWRARRRSSPLWALVSILVMCVALSPIVTILLLAISPTLIAPERLAATHDTWPHFLQYSLPNVLTDTLALLLGAGALTLVVGTGTAWLITMYRFPGRAILDRLMVLPLAIPTYIAAYTYVEFLDYTGPVQTFIRWLTGATLARDYWFIEVRSVGGAVLMMSSVLYPYVYLSARASFIQQSVCVLEVARTLGRTPFQTFLSVALPLARPALVAGVALVLMECLNDIGAVQILGVRSITESIFNTWMTHGNLPGAAQLATTLLGFVILTLTLERIARGGARHHHTTGRYRAIPFHDLEGAKGYAAFAVCCLPVLFGFVIPLAVLVPNAINYAHISLREGFVLAALNSLMLALIAAGLTATVALMLAYARRVSNNAATIVSTRLSSFGYAIPGTVLGLGLLFAMAAFDAGLNHAGSFVAYLWSGFQTAAERDPVGLVLSGSVSALVLAYVIRFLTVGLGTLEAGLERISGNLDAASRTLGETALSTLVRVHLPLLAPALGAAALLVFIDAMKELPATLLLRPAFGFETLSTHVYALASNERLEETALGAVSIIAVGLVPVLFLHRALTQSRPGSGQK